MSTVTFQAEVEVNPNPEHPSLSLSVSSPGTLLPPSSAGRQIQCSCFQIVLQFWVLCLFVEQLACEASHTLAIQASEIQCSISQGLY